MGSGLFDALLNGAACAFFDRQTLRSCIVQRLQALLSGVDVEARQLAGRHVAVNVQNGGDALVDMLADLRDQIDQLELVDVIRRLVIEEVILRQVRHRIIRCRVRICSSLDMLDDRHNARC